MGVFQRIGSFWDGGILASSDGSDQKHAGRRRLETRRVGRYSASRMLANEKSQM